MSSKRHLITILLSQLNPSGDALLDWLRSQIDDSMLREIAACDYDYHTDEHFAALVLIRDRNVIPVPLRGEPREVLNLTRYEQPDDPAWHGWLGGGTRGHLTRAFCCAILLKAADESETSGYILSENDTLIELIASVFALGREAAECATRFLAWRILRLPLSHEEYPFFALALLLLRAALCEPGESGEELAQLAAWVVREEARARTMPYARAWSDHWLLGLTNFDSEHEVWKKVAQETLLDPSKRFPSRAAGAMRGVVARLLRIPAPPRVFLVGPDGTIGLASAVAAARANKNAADGDEATEAEIARSQAVMRDLVEETERLGLYR